MGPETLERREVMAAELGTPYLVSDTGSPGDQITTDPRIGGTVGGAWNGASAIVEFDADADGIADGSRLLTSSGQSYTYDPRWFSEIAVGPGSIQQRLIERDAMGMPIATSAWSSFNFDYQPSTMPADINVEDSSGAMSIPDGSGSVNFGTTAPNMPISRTFMVRNWGYDTLTLDPQSIVLPAGFSLQSAPAATVAPYGSAQFTVRFDAASAGTSSGTLVLRSSDADENPYEFTISGTVGSLAPEMNVIDQTMAMPVADNTGSVDFGSTMTNMPITRSFTIQNTGSGTLTLNTPTLPMGFSLYSSFPTSIATGSQATFAVQMGASMSGTFSGSISITNNDSDENPYNFTVSGTVGGGSQSEIEIQDPTGYMGYPYPIQDNYGSLSLGTTTLGSPVTKTLTIVNSGQGSLTLSAPMLPSGFSLVGNFPTSVAPNSSASFSIRFDAAMPGTASGQFSVTTNDSDENPYNFSLSATANSSFPEIEVGEGASTTGIESGQSIADFGTTSAGSPVSRTFTIRNTGNSALNLSSGQITVPYGFALMMPPASIVNPGQTTSFSVQLSAGFLGEFTGLFAIPTNDSDENPFQFTLQGTVAGAPAEIEVLGEDFSPIQSGMGTIDFGSVAEGAVATRTLTIQNTGEQTLELDSTSLVLPAGFSLASSFPSALQPSQSASVQIQADTMMVGSFSGQVSFGTNDADENPFSFQVLVSVVPAAPEIEVGLGTSTSGLTSGSGIVDFGQTTQGNPVTRTLSIRNSGNVTLELDVGMIGLPAGYMLLSSPAASLAPTETTSLTLQLTADASGPQAGLLSIPTNDSDENPFTLNLTGQVAEALPEIAVQRNGVSLYDGQSSVDFGETTAGTFVPRTLTIQNEGSAPLELNPASLVLPAGYSLVGSHPESIPPGQSAALTIRLDAIAAGSYSGTLSIASNDADEASFDLQLTGSVLAANPELEVLDWEEEPLATGATIDFGITRPGVAITHMLTIANDGSTPLVIDPASFNLPAGFEFVMEPPATVQPGAWTTLGLKLFSSELGSYSGDWSLVTNDGDESPFILHLTGSVEPPPPEISLLAGPSLEQYENGETYDLGETLLGVPTSVRVLVSNLGDGPLTLNTSAIVLPAGYRLLDTPEATVQPGQYTEFFVELTALSTGSFTGQLSIPTNDPDENPLLLTLVGSVAVPAPVAEVRFGGLLVEPAGTAVSALGVSVVGAPIRGTFSITNLGTASLTASDFSVPAGFTLIDPPSGAIIPGTHTDLIVELSAASAGIFEGNLTFTTNDSTAATFTLPLRGMVAASATTLEVRHNGTPLAGGAIIDLGDIAAGTVTSITLEIQNTGSIPLVIDPAAIRVPAGMQLTAAPDSVVDPAATTTLTLSLNTTSPVNFSGTISFTSNGTAAPFQLSVLADVLANPSALGIGGVRLANDNGASAVDRITSDPRLIVDVINATAEELADLQVQLDLTGDGQAELSTAVDAAGVSHVDIDPRNLQPGEIVARVRLKNLATGDAFAWQSFIFNFALPDLRPTIASFALEEDTGAAGDAISANPTVIGTVTVTAGTNVDLQVAIDLDGDGAADFHTRTDSAGQFRVDPRAVSSSFRAGAATIRAKVSQFDPQRNTSVASDWAELSFEYALVRQLPVLQNLAVVLAANDLEVGYIRLTGSVVDPDAQTRFLAVQFDLNGDGEADGEATASPTADGRFQIDLNAAGWPAGTTAINLRGVKLVRETGERLSGNWQSLSFENPSNQPVLPELEALTFASDAASGALVQTINGQVRRQTAGVGGATVEYDLNDDGQRDGLAFSAHDGNGSFRLDISRHGLLPGQHTVKLRALVWDNAQRAMVAGEWESFTFAVGEPAAPLLPDLDGLALAFDTGTPADGITSRPVIKGVVSWSDATSGDFRVEYELLGGNSGSGSAIALAVRQGAFTIALDPAQLADPEVTLRVRAKGYLPGGQERTSEWQEFSFTLVEHVNVLPEVANIVLTEDTGDLGDNASRNATLTGVVLHEDGSVAVVPIQFDLNSDGQSDGFINTNVDGSFTLDLNSQFNSAGEANITLRAGELNETGQYVYGDWTSFSFTVERDGPPPTAVITGLRLYRDTGENETDGTTSDPRVTGSIELSDGSSAANLPIEIDYTGDGYADETIIADPTGGGFLADLRDRIHDSGSVTVRLRAGVPANTPSGFAYGEWTSITYDFQPDPIAVNTTPNAGLPSLNVTVVPPTIPAYAQYYSPTIPTAYGDMVGMLHLADVPGGQFDLWATRFYAHPLGNVDTVVTVNDTQTDTYPDAPNEGTLTVTTTVTSTLTTLAVLNPDSSWTVSEILVSSYMIVKSYTSPSINYTLTQSGFHNYTFAASGDTDDSLYTLTEARQDDWTHDREEPGGAGVTVESNGSSSQGSAFNAGGWRLIAAGGAVTEHEDWLYTTTGSGDNSIVTTTGDDSVEQESSFSSSGSDDIVTDLVSGVRTTTRDFLHTHESKASVTDGDSWSGENYSSSWDRTVSNESDSQWQGTVTIVDDGMTISRTGSYDQEWTSTNEWDVENHWQSTEIEATPIGSITRATTSDHEYYKQEKAENKQQWKISDEFAEPTGGSTDVTITIDTHDVWINDETKTLALVSGGSTVNHTIKSVSNNDLTGHTLDTTSSNYTMSAGGKSTGSSEAAVTTRYIQVSTESENETLNATGKITATGNSTYLGSITTDITTDKRSGSTTGSSGTDTWLAASEVGVRSGQWMHTLTSNISGSSGGGDAPLVTFTSSTQSNSSGSGKQTYQSNAYEESTPGSGYGGLGTDAEGKATITIPGLGALTPDYQDRTAQMSGVYAWNTSNSATVSGKGSPIPGVTSSFKASQSNSDNGTGGFAGSMIETMTGGDPSTRTLLASSNSQYNGNVTFSGSQDTSTSGAISSAPGQLTLINNSSDSSSSGTGTYSGKSLGTASGSGGTFTAKYTDETKSNSNYTFTSKGNSSYVSSNFSSPSYMSTSATTASWTNDGSGADGATYYEETNTATDGTSTFQSTATATSSVNGDVTNASKAVSATAGSTSSEDYSSSYSNSSQTENTSKGNYTTGSNSTINKINDDTWTKNSSSFSEKGDTTFSGEHKGTSTTTEPDSSGATRTTTVTTESSNKGTGTYASNNSSTSETTPTDSTSTANEDYLNTQKGDRKSKADTSLNYFGTAPNGMDMGIPGTTTSGSRSWGGSVTSTESDKANFTSSESGWSKSASSVAGMPGISDKSDETQYSETGDFEYSRKVNQWASEYSYSSSSSTSEGDKTETTSSSSSSSNETSNSKTDGKGTFSSSNSSLETSGTSGSFKQTKAADNRDDSGTVELITSTARSSSSWTNTKTPIYVVIELPPGEDPPADPPAPLYSTKYTSQSSSSSAGSTRNGTFTNKSNSSETVTNSVREALAHSESSGNGTSTGNSGYVSNSSENTNDGWGNTSDTQRGETSTTNSTGNDAYSSLQDDVTPLGGPTTSTAEFHSTDDSKGTITTTTASQILKQGKTSQDKDGANYNSGAWETYSRSGDFTTNGELDKYTTNLTTTKSHEKSEYDETGTFSLSKLVISTADANYDKEVKVGEGYQQRSIWVNVDYDQTKFSISSGAGNYSEYSEKVNDFADAKASNSSFGLSTSDETGTLFDFDFSKTVTKQIDPPGTVPEEGEGDPEEGEEEPWVESGSQTSTSFSWRDATYKSNSLSWHDTLNDVTEQESDSDYEETGTRGRASTHDAKSTTRESQGIRQFKVEESSTIIDSTTENFVVKDNSYSYSKTAGDNDSWHEQSDDANVTEVSYSNEWTKTTGKITAKLKITDPDTGDITYQYPDGQLTHTSKTESTSGYVETGVSKWYSKDQHKYDSSGTSTMMMPTSIESESYTGKQVGASSTVKTLDETYTKEGKTSPKQFPYKLEERATINNQEQMSWTEDITNSETIFDGNLSATEGSESSKLVETGNASWNEFTMSYYEVKASGPGYIAKMIYDEISGIFMPEPPADETEPMTEFIVWNRTTDTDNGGGSTNDKINSSHSWTKAGKHTYGGDSLETLNSGGVEAHNVIDGVTYDTKTVMGPNTTITQDTSASTTYSSDAYAGGKNWNTKTAEDGAKTQWGDAHATSAVTSGSNKSRSKGNWNSSPTSTSSNVETNGRGQSTTTMLERNKVWFDDGKNKLEEQEWKIDNTYLFRQIDNESKSYVTHPTGGFSRNESESHTFEQWGEMDKRAVSRVKVSLNWGETGFDLSIPIESVVVFRTDYAIKASESDTLTESNINNYGTWNYNYNHNYSKSLDWLTQNSVTLQLPTMLPGMSPIWPVGWMAGFASWPTYNEWGEQDYMAAESQSKLDSPTFDSQSSSKSTSTSSVQGKLGGDEGRVERQRQYQGSGQSSDTDGHSGQWTNNGSSHTVGEKTGGVDAWTQYDGQAQGWSLWSTPGRIEETNWQDTTSLAGDQISHQMDEQRTVSTLNYTYDADMNPTPYWETETFNSTYGPMLMEAPGIDWSTPAGLEVKSSVVLWAQYVASLGADLAELAMQFSMPFSIFDSEWMLASQMRSALQQTVNPGFQFNSVFEWASYNFVTTFVDEQRLINGGRFGTGLADDLMIAGLIATELVGYFDPTPISDTLNAGLNAADGNYADAAMSLAGALIPGGGDKAAKGAARVGGNIMEGMGDAARRANKAIDCNSSNRILSTMGSALGRCFAGDTEVVIDFAELESAASAGTGSIFSSPYTFVVVGAGAIAIGSVTAIRRRKHEDETILDELFADGGLEGVRAEEPLPQLDEPALDNLCQRLFAETPLETYAQDSDSAAWDDATCSSDSENTRATTATKTLPKAGKKTLPVAKVTTLGNKVASPKHQASASGHRWHWSSLALGLALLTLAAFGWNASSHPTALTAVSPASVAPSKYITQEIKDVKVGTWILAENPELANEEIESDWGDLDAATWRWLVFDMVKADGAHLRIDLLRPEWWLEENLATQTGAIVELDMEEIGAAGPARLLENNACPVIETRPSTKHHLVTGKFSHDAAGILNLYVAGMAEPIRCTSNHPFWSEDRQAFVQASLLRTGERLRTSDGSIVAVSSHQLSPLSAPVFNLEVERQHVYYVSSQGILVHNAYTADQIAKRMGRTAEGKGWRHAVDDLGHTPVKSPYGKHSSTPGADYMTWDAKNKELHIWDAKYRKDRRYPNSVTKDQMRRWKKEAADFIRNEISDPALKKELLEALRKNNIVFQIFAWPT